MINCDPFPNGLCFTLTIVFEDIRFSKNEKNTAVRVEKHSEVEACDD